jgi:hypothetical protein
MTQIRGVFPLPQTSPQIAGVDQVVELGSGCVYVMPSGNYLCATGPNTALEWFDPLATQWRPMVADPAYNEFSSDGTNYRLVNMTGGVSTVTVSGAGSGGTNGIGPVQTGTTVAFSASPTGAWMTAQGYGIVGGSVPAPTVTQAGSNFVVPPIVCCDPPPVGGIQATFVAQINASGGIASVTQVNPGAGYTSVPQFYVIPQPQYWQGGQRWPGDTIVQPWPAPGLVNQANVWPGTIFQPNIATAGALLTGNALTGSGTLTGIVVIYNGGGYATGTPPTLSFAGGSLTGMTATATVATAPANDVSYLQAKVN